MLWRKLLTFAQRWAGLLALFLVLATGTAYALPGSNTVFSDDIVDAQVTAADIGSAAVASDEIKNAAITANDVVNNTLGGGKIRDGGLTGTDVADDSLTGADIDDAALPTSGVAQNPSVVPIAAGGTDVVTGEITTTGTSRILINATAELFGSDADERAKCFVGLDGSVISLSYETTFDDIGGDNEATVSVATSADNVPAGTHRMTMTCAPLAGTVSKDDASINAVGIPVQ